METLQIINAVVVGNLTVRLYFNDNSEQIVDIGDFIRRKPHPQYNKYLNENLFKCFKIENGNARRADRGQGHYRTDSASDNRLLQRGTK